MQPAARLSLLAPALVALALSGCGGDDDKSTADIEAEISTQLVEGGLDEESADCVAAVIVEEVGTEELQDVDFSADEPPAELEEAISAASITAFGECELGSAAE